jgi:lipopolysaccharide export system protein LptA
LKQLAFLFLLVFLCKFSFAQTFNSDSANRVIRIIEDDRIVVSAKDSFKIVVGNPLIIKQGNTIFKADSVYIDERVGKKFMEAFGRVYINESDSVITKAGYIKYYTEKKVAELKKDVSIKSKGGTFIGNEVEYDLNTKMATYKNGGKIISKKSVLTSKAGQYFSNSKDALFTNDVVLKGPDNNITTDSLYYNSDTEIANFVTYTKIVDYKKKRTVETTRGYYDAKKGKAVFTERTQINDNGRTLVGDRMDLDDKAKTLLIEGRGKVKDSSRTIIGEYIFADDIAKKLKVQGKGFIEDTVKKETISGDLIEIDEKNQLLHIERNGVYKNEKEGIVLTGNLIDSDGKTGRSLATGKPVAIVKQENDSIYIAADTLFSGKIIGTTKIRTDSITKMTYLDTLKNKDVKDTTYRYLEAFHHVRIFSDSAQGVCDSLYYSDIDSVFRMYDDPVVWNDKSQITGDTIYLFTENKKAKRAEVFEKGFVINIVEDKFYNQIRATKITTYFKEGSLDSLYAKGSAEIIFYIQDEDKAYVGVDKSSADVIIAYFENKEIYKIKWLNKYDAVTTPMKDVNHNTLRLRNFKLQLDRRPKNKFELFF